MHVYIVKVAGGVVVEIKLFQLVFFSQNRLNAQLVQF